MNSEKDNAKITNKVVAYILPLDNISIDGDLSDWPSDMDRYSLDNQELGDSIVNADDYSGNFRIGYNKDQNALFIAMEVIDQSLVTDTTNGVNWNTHDGVELYLDQAHLKTSSPVTQYSEYGDKRMVFGSESSWDAIEMKKKVTDKGRNFEWKINLDQPIKLGSAIGLDLVVTDKDEDNSFSWISWTRGTQKVTNPERCGIVIPVATETKTEFIEGQLDLAALEEKNLPVSVRITAKENPALWLQAVADSLGNYAFLVPSGTYEIEVPGKLMNHNYRFYRLAPSEPKTVTVDSGVQNALPTIAPKLVPEPDLWADTGLLHNFGEQEREHVDNFIEAYQKYYNIPGVSLALIKDGKVAYHKTYGLKNTETGAPVDHSTLFEAASITKPVFAYVVLRLAEKGIIDMDKPLHQYLKFDELETSPEYKKMTARHVLIHRSGLPNWGRNMINIPGEKYGYSGEGFEYLKRVVVKITGKSIEQILDEELINPFGLYHMEFSDNPELREVVAIGHMGGKPTYWDIPREAGMAFSMHTEAKAFSKFALMLLEEKGLSKKTYNELMTLHTPSNSEYWNDKTKPEGAGLGIFIRKTNFGDAFGHGGNNGDFKCQFEVVKDLKMGFAIFTNSDTGSELTNDIVYLLIEGGKPLVH